MMKEQLGDNMKQTPSLRRDFETIAWGAILIWWGITELIPSLPTGTGVLGIGLILLGLNAARHYSGIPMNRFSITLGVLALVWGGLELAGFFLPLPFEIPIFAILLLTLGVIVLAREFSGKRNESIGGLQ
jgi:hypothetical protein